MISAVILTKNEEKNIKRCLKSVSWCDEIVVVDDYSKDNTMSVVSCQLSGTKEKKIRILKRRLNGDYAKQRNYGLLKAKGEWVFFLDADEAVSESLAFEIKSRISNFTPSISKTGNSQNGRLNHKLNSFDGFYIKRKDFFLGKRLKYGETGNIKIIRLGKKDSGVWQGRIHEKWDIKGKTDELENPIFHFPHRSIKSFLIKINRYTDLVAQCWLEQGKRMSPLEIIFYPAGKFIHNYFFRLGFLDGTAGLIMALMMSFHSFLARSKYWFDQK